MTIAVMIRPEESARLLPWAESLARAREEDLLVIGTSNDGSTQVADPVEVRSAAELLEVVSGRAETGEEESPQSETDAPDAEATDPAPEPAAEEDPAALSVVRANVAKDETGEAILALLEERRPSLLILPRPLAAEGPVRRVFRGASCATMVLETPPERETPQEAGADVGSSENTPPREGPRILVPTSTGGNARLALELACTLAGENGRVEALYVEPRIGQEAERVGRRILQQEVAKALGMSQVPTIHSRVAIANDPAEGIIRVASEGRYDLLLVGATEGIAAPRMRKGTIPDRVRKEVDTCAVGVVRRGIPLAHRLERRLIRFLRAVVPQLSREERVELVGKIQSSSSFNFDFVTLVCLSTLIAGLGLIRNSAAVVIGAMLVAPLMTPLVGCGLALVHGNLVLIRNAARSVFLGFTLSFAIGLALGLLIPGVVGTEELLARGEPDILDLLVAGASGLAAAYATARPALSGALPGLAIAAALVPPIATTGIATALGQWSLALGALLLFNANIVAIVLGAAVSLYAVGLRGDRPKERRHLWIRPTIATLLVVIFGLALTLGYFFYRSLPAARVSPELASAIETILEENEVRMGTRMPRTRVQRSPGADYSESIIELEVWIEATKLPNAELARDIAAKASELLERPVRARLKTDLVIAGESGR